MRIHAFFAKSRADIGIHVFQLRIHLDQFENEFVAVVPCDAEIHQQVRAAVYFIGAVPASPNEHHNDCTFDILAICWRGQFRHG